METDEAGTLSVLKSHRKDVIDPKIAEHHGRISAGFRPYNRSGLSACFVPSPDIATRPIKPNCLPSACRLPKSGHRMAAEGAPFPWWWDGGMTSTNLDVT
jgi:hypothetical protein